MKYGNPHRDIEFRGKWIHGPNVHGMYRFYSDADGMFKSADSLEGIKAMIREEVKR